MYIKIFKRKLRNGAVKESYSIAKIIKNNNPTHKIKAKLKHENCAGNRKIIWLGIACLDELISLANSLNQIIEIKTGTSLRHFNPSKTHRDRLKQEIKKLYQKHGKLNERLVRFHIGHKNYFHHFGGMNPIYMELSIPLPKARGKEGSYGNMALLNSLQGALNKHGKLNKHIIKAECIVVPSTYIHRFGSLPNAYKLIGYQKENNNG